MLCATWNVNAKKLDFASDPDPMGSWLFPPESAPHGYPDIAAVGFQEIVDLNAVNVAVDSKAAQRSAVWQEQVRTCELQSDESRTCKGSM